MEWLLRWTGEHWGPLAALIAFPFIVWAELQNYLPFGRKRDERNPR